MKHLGDICKINGAEVEPVSVIIGGSPCQDLSVAGKRAGLDGARSGLFMEQIRVIKEMRENDRNNGRTGELCRPRYMVWENVPGAFSSNKGEDFRIVLEETAKIADPEISIPRPPQGKWTNAGCIVGRGYSIAWRVLDAQYFGVPQRRRRIALVADFGGESAPEILFKPESLSRNIEQSGTERQGTAGDAERSVDKTICYGISAYESNAMKSSNPHSGVYKADTSRTLDNNEGGQSSGGIGYADEQAPTLQATPSALEPTVVCLEGNGSRESHKGNGYRQSDIMYTLNTIEKHAVCCLNDQGGSVMSTTENITSTLRAQEHGHQPIVYDARGNGNGELAPTITGDHQNRVTDYTALCIGNGQADQTGLHDLAGALNCMHDQQAVMTYGLDRASYSQGQNAKFDFSVEEEKIGAQTASSPGAIYHSVVRRLTPLECERLQSYPDYWTHIGDWTDSKGKKHKDSDSPKYKALGNSIAVPCWRFILQGISERVQERTMASLFDGIGGFPLIWEEINGSKSCRWVSEIEEFPIAVTKMRFEQE